MKKQILCEFGCGRPAERKFVANEFYGEPIILNTCIKCPFTVSVFDEKKLYEKKMNIHGKGKKHSR